MPSMPLKIDHVVLDAGAFFDETIASLESAGFCVSPESNYPGMRNRRMYFQNTYFTIVQKPNDGSPVGAVKGITILNFKGTNLGTVAEDLRTRGFVVSAPEPHSRSIELNGTTATARFDILDLPREPFCGLAACAVDHRTPELVWRPEWQSHRNGVRDLVEIVMLTGSPRKAAIRAGRLFSTTEVHEPEEGVCRVGEGGGLSFASAEYFETSIGRRAVGHVAPSENSVACLRFASNGPQALIQLPRCPFLIEIQAGA